MKYISLDFGQLESPELNTPWNPPACLIRFETQEINNLGNNINQISTNVIFKFIMKDFSKHQLLCLDYSVMLAKKINGTLGASKVMENYFVDQDVNYIMEFVYNVIYREDLNTDLGGTGLIENVNIGLLEVEKLSDTEGEGFASDGLLIIPPLV
jgi:hypothetical protein